MNLFDILKRNDRCLEVVTGNIESVRFDRPLWYYAVLMQPGAHIRLKRADEFIVLASFPRDLGWSAASRGSKAPSIRVSVRSVDGAQSSSIAEVDRNGAITLTWPSWPGLAGEFDLDIINKGDEPVEVKSGPVFDPRAAARGLLQGTGIEVGPGSNPFVKPGPTVDIRYVEALPIEEWLRNYGKHIEITPQSQEMWSRYIIGDAQRIECCEDETLDFIFSNHVFEHLMNPLGVLENWSRKLKSSGVIIGVVPDLRYCFDLRQPPSTPLDWISEYEAGAWTLTIPKYEKWCRYTAPYNTPKDLIARNYSIHAHYYTPAGFRELAQMAIDKGFCSHAFLSTSPNNKDFGWILWKNAPVRNLSLRSAFKFAKPWA